MNATKYTFDTVFDDDFGAAADVARARKRRTFTEAEVEQLTNQARNEGLQAGEVRAQEAIAVATKEAGNAIKGALALMERQRRKILEENTGLALALATKLSHVALTKFPQGEVEAALREAMHQAIGEPRIVLKASPAVAEKLAPKASEIAHEEAFDGRIQVSADPALSRADCRIEWRGGGAERASATLEAALKDIITRNFRDSEDDHGE